MDYRTTESEGFTEPKSSRWTLREQLILNLQQALMKLRYSRPDESPVPVLGHTICLNNQYRFLLPRDSCRCQPVA